MIQPLLNRLAAVLERALNLAGVSKEEVYTVEIIGGSTRIPAVKQTISQIIGREPMTTLNMDECTAKGCALMVCFACIY
jgi:heat shock protein 4